jgi:hypothetical protein
MPSLCPNCVRPMRLMRAIGRSGGLADLNIFECKNCHLSMTEAVARPATEVQPTFPLRPTSRTPPGVPPVP